MPLSQTSALRKDLAQPSGNSMQHRHFATIATIIREMRFDADRQATAEHFADYLHSTNPKFDRQRFLAACKSGRE